jgi:hypothetical protein
MASCHAWYRLNPRCPFFSADVLRFAFFTFPFGLGVAGVRAPWLGLGDWW